MINFDDSQKPRKSKLQYLTLSHSRRRHVAAVALAHDALRSRRGCGVRRRVARVDARHAAREAARVRRGSGAGRGRPAPLRQELCDSCTENTFQMKFRLTILFSKLALVCLRHASQQRERERLTARWKSWNPEEPGSRLVQATVGTPLIHARASSSGTRFFDGWEPKRGEVYYCYEPVITTRTLQEQNKTERGETS